MPQRSKALHVQVHDGEIIVTQPEHGFCAFYVLDKHKPQLVLKHRAQSVDEELNLRALQAAVSKARELGWIV